jgi:hypothetical protein
MSASRKRKIPTSPQHIWQLNTAKNVTYAPTTKKNESFRSDSFNFNLKAND